MFEKAFWSRVWIWTKRRDVVVDFFQYLSNSIIVLRTTEFACQARRRGIQFTFLQRASKRRQDLASPQKQKWKLLLLRRKECARERLAIGPAKRRATSRIRWPLRPTPPSFLKSQWTKINKLISLPPFYIFITFKCLQLTKSTIKDLKTRQNEKTILLECKQTFTNFTKKYFWFF